MSTRSGVSGRLIVTLFSSWLFTSTLAACQSSSAAPAEAAAPSRATAELAVDFVRLFTSGGLSEKSAGMLLGEGSTTSREGAYWQIRRHDGQQQIVMRAVDPGQTLDDAELRLDLNADLTLADLEKKFGSWQVVAESKTSSVRFRVSETGGIPTVVFVRLFTPKVAADSPVVSLQLRRDSTP